ncbi:hypothetical protein OT109_08715 [Phycisphaeraceae bacterium D3-23]
MTTQPTIAPDTTARNRARYGVRGQRGSAIILVVVSIVLMAILGATFVQVARFERVATGGEHIDIAINSVLNEVAAVLTKDLIDDNGNFFNHTGSDFAGGGGDEPFDFPWTNASVSQREVTYLNSVNDFAQGGLFDDPWLSATTLEINGAVNEWRHVSDLTGKFLDNGAGSIYADRDLTTFNNSNPGEVAATAAMVEGIDINDMRLVDADGDGVGDSLWAYAPAAEIAGKRYVYAIRIVDLSGRLNVNTALGMTDGGGNPNAGVARGDTPTEADGTGLAFDFAPAAGAAQATAVGEYNTSIARRYGGGATVPVAWGDAADERRHFWLNGASLVDTAMNNQATLVANYDPADLYGEGDLYELLYRNGLNNGSVFSQLEDDMPDLLRRNSFNEFTWNTGTPATMNATYLEYLRDNARIHLTTISGAMAIAPPSGTANTLIGPDHSGDTVGERILRADINHSSLTELTTVIEETLNAGGTFSMANYAHFASVTELAAQLAANIVDMRDTDNRLTSHNGQFGMEALPFITEVYAQREYAVPPAGIPNGTMPETYTITFAAVSPADYAIEIRNPFPRPIDLSGVHLVVAGTSWGEISALPTAPTELLPGEVLIIHRTNSAAPENVAGGVAANHFVDLSATGNQWPNGAGNFSVGLHAEDQAAAGTALPWAYSRVDTESLPRNYTENMATNPLPIEPRPFMEISDQGTGTGLNMLQTRPTDVVQSRTEPSEARGAGQQLGVATKAFAPANNWDTGDQQWLFLDKQTSAIDNDGRIPYVADVLTIPVVGPNDASAPDNTLGDAIAQSAATRLDDFMLDYRRNVASPAAVISNVVPSLNVPHAVLLLERLTTHSPAVDGEDLDGDGVDVAVGGVPDYDEAHVPGKINLNTADPDFLASILPYPTAAQRSAVAARILAFRENPGARSANARSTTQPGIAYTGELYDSLIGDLSGLNPQPDWNDHQLGGMTSGGTFVADGITGDREEDLMLAKWLNEVCGTRSDVFAVYLVVQGFPAGNFGAGPVESARVIAVFSRSNVRQIGDSAQLLAVRRVE